MPKRGMFSADITSRRETRPVAASAFSRTRDTSPKCCPAKAIAASPYRSPVSSPMITCSEQQALSVPPPYQKIGERGNIATMILQSYLLRNVAISLLAIISPRQLIDAGADRGQSSPAACCAEKGI
jgi:hypothetical protein